MKSFAIILAIVLVSANAQYLYSSLYPFYGGRYYAVAPTSPLVATAPVTSPVVAAAPAIVASPRVVATAPAVVPAFSPFVQSAVLTGSNKAKKTA
ncbi:hypothetical protein QR680_006885 [Steinernema hermaphroditum]|uniref:Uncharacterized protein n=1 Tax=Steinernema hermaphroditum TaxID=289476 RepID=A0AA39LXU1_9BILA|nr:hypothetical protein QR680_006885 [Steinernema hermaphroditum]